MSASAIIRRVRDAGGEIGLAADGIRLRVPVSLRGEVIGEVKANKATIRLALKAEAGDPWDADDYRAFYDECSGIAEFDGGLARGEAEALAFESCVTEWLNRNFVRSLPGRCLARGGHPDAHDPLLPYGTERIGHAWLHFRCWPDWHAARTAEAISALAAMGLPTWPTCRGKSQDDRRAQSLQRRTE